MSRPSLILEEILQEKKRAAEELAQITLRLRELESEIATLQREAESICCHAVMERGSDGGIDERPERVCIVCGYVE